MGNKFLYFFLASFIFILGCSNKNDEAKKKGFYDVAEMERMNANGFATYEDYLQDLLPKSGCSNIAELKHALGEVGGDCNYLKEQRKVSENKNPPKFILNKSYLLVDKNGVCSKNTSQYICVKIDEWKALCNSAKTISIGVVRVLSYDIREPKEYADATEYLIKNGGLNDLNFDFNSSAVEEKSCEITAKVSGVYKGTQLNRTLQGIAAEFEVDNDGVVSVFYANSIPVKY